MGRSVLIRLLAIFVLSGVPASYSASAQDVVDLALRLWDFFSAPSARLEPSYVFQPNNGLSVAAGYTVARNSVMIDSNEEIFT